MSEHSDAVVVIVSEETGSISAAMGRNAQAAPGPGDSGAPAAQ